MIVPNVFGASAGSWPAVVGRRSCIALRLDRGGGLSLRLDRSGRGCCVSAGSRRFYILRARLLSSGAIVLAASGVGALAFDLLEAELVIFLHLPHLFLHLQDLEVQFLDRAAQLPDLLLERRDPGIARLRQPKRSAVGRCLTSANAGFRDWHENAGQCVG